MGRTEKEITTSNAALHDLAQWLRDRRAQAGLTYRQLAGRAGVHATTLQRAASGDSVPRLMPVLAYAGGCDAPPEEARRLWRRARREHVRSVTQHSQPAPAPALVRDFADLSAALRDLYEEAGAPSLRSMEERAGGLGALPRSSAHRIVNKQTVPHCLQQFQAFLQACEVPAEHRRAWEDAWSRAWRFEKQEDAGLNEVPGVLPQRQHDRITRDRDRIAVRHEGVVVREVLPDARSGDVIRTELEGPRYHRPLAPRRRSTDPIPTTDEFKSRLRRAGRRLSAAGEPKLLFAWPTDATRHEQEELPTVTEPAPPEEIDFYDALALEEPPVHSCGLATS